MARSSGNEKSWIGIAHSRIPHDVTDGPAWRVLSFSAKALYVDLRAKLRSTNNGNINATLSEMKHRGWSSPVTLSKALRQLERMGFIAKTRQGGIASMSKICSLYRFTDLLVHEHPKQGIPATKETHDYRGFRSVGEAKAALYELNGGKSNLQKMKLQGTDSVPIPECETTENVQEPPSKLQKMYKGKRQQVQASKRISAK